MPCDVSPSEEIQPRLKALAICSAVVGGIPFVECLFPRFQVAVPSDPEQARWQTPGRSAACSGQRGPDFLAPGQAGSRRSGGIARFVSP